MITILICLAGILLIPWLDHNYLATLRKEEEQYEQDHLEELYGTDIMHVDSAGNVDTHDWEEK